MKCDDTGGGAILKLKLVNTTYQSVSPTNHFVNPLTPELIPPSNAA
jgi:hypothetical protein